MLSGQVAWVTGSSRGIGRAIAEELSRLGARVCVHGTRSDSPRSFGAGVSMQQVAGEIADKTGSETMAVWGDLTRERETARVAQEIRDRWDRIDVLVCCAGGSIGAKGTQAGQGGRPASDDCLHISLPDLQSVLARNLMSAVLCCREVVPHMIERRSGRIVTIGSTGGCIGISTLATYRMAKAAVHEYTRCLADQLREHNVTVNSVLPGSIASERWLHAYGGERDEVEPLAKSETLDRVGHVGEVASVVGFLCSPSAGYVSGQLIRVDGGQHLFAC